MNVIASGAFECSDVKAGRAGGDTCQHRHRFALRTWWSVKRAHDAVPCIRRERDTLSHRADARDGPVMGIVSTRAPRNTGQYRPPLGKVNEGKLGRRRRSSGKKVGTRLGEAYKRAALMQHQSAIGDGAI